MADEEYLDASELGSSADEEPEECQQSCYELSGSSFSGQASTDSEESDNAHSSTCRPAKTCNRCGKALVTDVCLCLYKIPFRCEKCPAHLADLSEFQIHMRTHVNVPLMNKKPQNIDILQSETKELHECATCKKIFNTKLSLVAHSLTHAIDGDRSVRKCPHCGREFTSSVRLSTHITKIHVEEKKFSCDVCNKTFLTRITLDAHVKLHLGMKPYKCDICGKSYGQSGNLAYHKSAHAGVKSYVCHLCGKTFLTGSILANHERRHAGLKPFVCDTCGRGFVDNYSLTHHKVIHSGVRSFVCDVCGKAFIHRHTLLCHKRIHSGDKRYRCSICDRAFTQMSTMLQHRNTHTGEKSYRCVCGKAFTQQSSLARHRRIHDNVVVSFFCNLCDKKFAYKCTLNKHKRRTHGIETTGIF